MVMVASPVTPPTVVARAGWRRLTAWGQGRGEDQGLMQYHTLRHVRVPDCMIGACIALLGCDSERVDGPVVQQHSVRADLLVCGACAALQFLCGRANPVCSSRARVRPRPSAGCVCRSRVGSVPFLVLFLEHHESRSRTRASNKALPATHTPALTHAHLRQRHQRQHAVQLRWQTFPHNLSCTPPLIHNSANPRPPAPAPPAPARLAAGRPTPAA